MNLALILHALSRNNGISRVVLSLTGEFAKNGHDVHIYASRLLLSEGERRALPRNVFLHRFPCLRGSNRIWAAPAGALVPFLKKSHDLVISHMLTVWQDVIVMHNDPQPVEVEKMSAVPFTLDKPRLRSKNRFLRTLVEKMRFAPQRYKGVVAISERSAGEISGAYGVPRDRIAVIRHGLDHSYFSPEERQKRRKSARALLDLSDRDLVFIYIGDSWKGLEFAIKGIASGGAGNRVLVASGPFHEKKFMALASDLGLRLICQNSWEDIRDLYAAGDIFINPTPMDTFGLAVLEAAGMGLPVITTRYAGVSELFRNEENAFILDRPWDVEAIAEISDRLSDPGFRELISGRAVRVAAGLSWEKPAAEHLAFYERVSRAAKPLP